MSLSMKNVLTGSLKIFLFSAGASLLLMPTFLGAQEDLSEDLKAGREIYLKSCSACHGADGKGQPQSSVGFDTPIPDFADSSGIRLASASGKFSNPASRHNFPVEQLKF